MTISQAITEWEKHKRRMGCVAATDWFCKRVKTFKPLRRKFYLPGGTDKNGELWEHVVATDGKVIMIYRLMLINQGKLTTNENCVE